MDYINYVKLVGVIAFLKVVYAVSVPSLKNSEVLTEDLNTNSLTKNPRVTLSNPRKLEILMGSDLELLFDYMLPCNGSNNFYLIEIESVNPDLFTVDGKGKTFVETCESHEFTSKHTQDKNQSNSDDLKERTTLIAKVLEVEGSVKVKLHGILLGMGTLKIKVKNSGNNFTMDLKDRTNIADIAEYSFSVSVLRIMRPVDNAFRVIVACFVSIVIMGFGCSLDLEVVKECFKKPLAPALGLACQYVLMPLIGFTIAKLVPVGDQAITFGIFVCGVCPGGGSSNVYSFLLGGDINLSITMTCIGTVAALGLMPFWVYTLGSHFLDNDFNVVIPYVNMLQTLAMITVPLFIGVVVKHKFPNAAIKFVKILKPVTVIMMLIFLVVGIFANLYIFNLIKPMYFIAGSLLPYIGYITGGLVAFIFRQPWTRIKTIAIETGMQNTSIAYLLMVASFPAPLGDIAAMAPISSAVATPILPFLITIPYLLHKRLKKRYEIASYGSSERTDDFFGGKSNDIDIQETEINSTSAEQEVVVGNDVETAENCYDINRTDSEIYSIQDEKEVILENPSSA